MCSVSCQLRRRPTAQEARVGVQSALVPPPQLQSPRKSFSVIVTDRSRQIRASFFVEEIVYLATCHPLSLCILWLCSPLWPLLTPLPVVLLWLEVWGDLPYAVTEQPMD